jgi:hypothetical protein
LADDKHITSGSVHGVGQAFALVVVTVHGGIHIIRMENAVLSILKSVLMQYGSIVLWLSLEYILAFSSEWMHPHWKYFDLPKCCACTASFWKYSIDVLQFLSILVQQQFRVTHSILQLTVWKLEVSWKLGYNIGSYSKSAFSLWTQIQSALVLVCLWPLTVQGCLLYMSHTKMQLAVKGHWSTGKMQVQDTRPVGAVGKPLFMLLCYNLVLADP